VCGIGSPTYHPWIAPGKKRKKNKVEQFLAELYPLLSHNEIKMLAKLNTREDLYRLAQDTGMNDKDIDKMFGDE
jgi:cell division FtsZ-interacting protein ZapD